MLSRNVRAESRRDGFRTVFIAAWGGLALAGLAGTACGQASTKRFQIDTAAIVSAMQHRQIPVAGVQVSIAAPVTSLSAKPELTIRELIPKDEHTAQLLLACRNAAECLPFYITASWPAQVDVARLRGSVTHVADSTREWTHQGFAGDGTFFRAGSPATLLLDGARVHVQLRVLCLESGQPGDQVRVTTPDRRQEYLANVIAPGVLKGTF